MATRPVVPRADGEGSVGTAIKKWGSGAFQSLVLATGAIITKFSIDGTLESNSDEEVPTVQAVKTYVDTALESVGGTTHLRIPGTDLSWIGPDYRGDIDLAATVSFGVPLYMANNGELRVAGYDIEINPMISLYLATGTGTGIQLVIAPNTIVRNDAWDWNMSNDRTLWVGDGVITQTRPELLDGHKAICLGLVLTSHAIHFLPSGVTLEVY